MAERIEGHYPVAPTRELAGERSLHLLRKEQPRQQHGGTRALSPDGVGEALAIVTEVLHPSKTYTGRHASSSAHPAVAPGTVCATALPGGLLHGKSSTVARRHGRRNHRRRARNRKSDRRSADCPRSKG